MNSIEHMEDSEDVPKWAKDMMLVMNSRFDGIDCRIDGMQGSIDGLRTLLNSTCDRVSALENRG